MKLPDFLIWSELNALRQQMGAYELGELSLKADPNRLTEAELEKLVNGGLDVAVDEVRVLPDGTLAYKDSRVLVYIRDVASYGRRQSGGTEGLPRFHFANCDTLQKMRQEKRYDRYVVAARQDGLFEVNLIENNRIVQSSPERLRVCQNCLAALAFDGFSMSMQKEARLKRVGGFRLERFFELYGRALMIDRPSHNSDSGPANLYPDDFEAVASRIKEARGWRCEGEECGVVLRERTLRKYMHVHHVNGLKHDSRDENLVLLCLVCHSNQPYHGHMSNLRELEHFRSIRERLLHPDRSKPSRPTVNASGEFSDDAFKALVSAYDLDYEDNRGRRGALWVRAEKVPRQISSNLERWGFRYKEGRGWWRS